MVISETLFSESSRLTSNILLAFNNIEVDYTVFNENTVIS